MFEQKLYMTYNYVIVVLKGCETLNCDVNLLNMK